MKHCMKSFFGNKVVVVVVSLTKCPSGTVITQVQVMLPAKLRGYRGEKSPPVSPVKGITLSWSGYLQGPMAAKMK